MKETMQPLSTQHTGEQGYTQQPPVFPTADDLPAGNQPAGYGPPPLYPPYADFQRQQDREWQPTNTPAYINPFEMTSLGMKARTAGLLCYLFSWIGGLVFFLLEKENRFVRFHAAQSILFFGAMSILEAICSLFPFALFGLGGIVGLVGFIGWIILMVTAYQGRYYKLPFFGDYAEQLANRTNR